MEKRGTRLVIIGGVAAGATAAARARRLDESADITIVEKGRYVSFANCGLPYFISRDIQKRSALILQTPEGFYSRYRVKVLLETEAVSIDRNAKTVTVRDVEGERALPYDSLILAQGGLPFVPPLEGADGPNVFKLQTIPEMDAVTGYIESSKAKSAVVVGGGFIGLEAAEAFVKRGLSTTIVELTDHVMPPADREFGELIRRAYEAAGARVLTGVSVTKLARSGESGTAVLSDGSTVPADVVLLSVGVRPNVALAKAAGLELGPTGGVAVDESLRTGDPAIWAAGDMIEIAQRVSGKKTRVPLAGPANRQGRIAATNALGGSMKYRGALGSSVFKAMDDTFAMTGLGSKAAADAGFDAASVVVHRNDHASYYPGANELTLKLIYDRKSARVLGAQAFGRSGVEKRVDVIATAIAGGLTVHDLAELDLSYAPPYDSANDPVNMAAFAAENDLSGYSRVAAPAEALAPGAAVLDVRTLGDFGKKSLPGSVHVPLDELRDRIGELDTGAAWLILSRNGYEGHIATRILVGAGFENARYVTGGMKSVELESSFA